MKIYWNKRKRLHKKRVHLLEDWFGTPTWPPFHCFGTPIWAPWRHVKTLHTRLEFFNGFKISGKDQLILAVIFRFGSKKLDKRLAVSLPGVKTLIKH